MCTVFKRNSEGNYIIRYYDFDGKRKERSSKTTDKRTAVRIANKLEADVALRRSGVVNPHTEKVAQESRSLIEKHLKSYEDLMISGKRDPKHIRSTLKYIRDICRSKKFVSLEDITADGVNSFASTLIKQGKSARTVQAHLTAIKSFTKWLNQHDKLAHDSLASVKKPNPAKDRRKERRMLLPDEWVWLRSAILAENVQRYGMTAHERVLFYALAIQTGLRAAELYSLKRGQLYLSVENPYVTCKAKNTKNGKDAKQYIKADLAEELHEYLQTKKVTAEVFPLPDLWDFASMLRDDLAAARTAWVKAAQQDSDEIKKRQQSDFLLAVNHDGQALDFHSLRHTCGAWLAMTGAHPKAIQSVMRHSTIVLTMDTYGHLIPGQDATTVAQFPSMLQNANEGGGEKAQEDGSEKPHPKRHQLARETVQSSATPCDDSEAEYAVEDTCNLLNNNEKCEALQGNAKENKNMGGGARTPNLLIRSQLLYPIELRPHVDQAV